MAEKSFEDNDQSVYKTHILYFLPKDAHCAKLMSTLEAHALADEVFLQDVAQLQQRPPWLDGVPILVCKKNNQAYKGQHIYTYLKEYQTDDFMPANAATGGWANFDDGESNGAFERKFSSYLDPAMFDLEEEGGGSGTRAPTSVQAQPSANESASLSEKQQRRKASELEAQQRAQEMMNVRQQQDQMLQSRQKGSAVPVPRNAFGDDEGQPVLRHPPPVPATVQQRAPAQRVPQYGQPQHYQQQPAPAAPAPTQTPGYYQQPPAQPQYYAPQHSAQHPAQHPAQQQYYQQAPAQYHQQPHAAPYYQQPHAAPQQVYQQPQVPHQYYQQAPASEYAHAQHPAQQQYYY